MKAVKPLATSDQESRKLKASAITERVQDKHPEHLGTRQLARNQDKRFKRGIIQIHPEQNGTCDSEWHCDALHCSLLQFHRIS